MHISQEAARASKLDGDKAKVIELMNAAGGLISKRPPDMDKPRKGQTIVVGNDDLDFEDEAQRPDDNTLQRISFADLVPPPSSDPVPLDFSMPSNIPDFVKEQRIEFLIVQRKANCPNEPWEFPPQKTVQELFDFIRSESTNDQIMEICL